MFPFRAFLIVRALGSTHFLIFPFFPFHPPTTTIPMERVITVPASGRKQHHRAVNMRPSPSAPVLRARHCSFALSDPAIPPTDCAQSESVGVYTQCHCLGHDPSSSWHVFIHIVPSLVLERVEGHRERPYSLPISMYFAVQTPCKILIGCTPKYESFQFILQILGSLSCPLPSLRRHLVLVPFVYCILFLFSCSVQCLIESL